jgi:hypothetical protein
VQLSAEIAEREDEPTPDGEARRDAREHAKGGTAAITG